MQEIHVSMFQSFKNTSNDNKNILFYETFPETFMKHNETFGLKRVTSLFHECFTDGLRNLLFFLIGIFRIKSLKHGCFIKCFMEITSNTPIKADFGVVKHFWPENIQNRFFRNGRLIFLGASTNCILSKQFMSTLNQTPTPCQKKSIPI